MGDGTSRGSPRPWETMPPWLIEDNSWGARAHAASECVSSRTGRARGRRLFPALTCWAFLGGCWRGLGGELRAVGGPFCKHSILPVGLAQRVALSERGFSCCSGDFTKRDGPVHILGFSIGNMECAA